VPKRGQNIHRDLLGVALFSFNKNIWSPCRPHQRQGCQMVYLPDGIFSYQKSKFELIWEGLEILYLEYYTAKEFFTTIWYILWPFSTIFCGHLVQYFVAF
jgi:hypothetical protein